MSWLVFTDIVLPNVRANVIQRFQMAEALSDIEDVTVIIKRGRLDENIMENIGIRKAAKVITTGYSSITLHRLSALLYLYSFRVVYTRDIFFSFITAILGKKTILELHTCNFSRSQRIVFKAIELLNISRVNVVCISQGLSSDFCLNFPNISTHIVHDGISIKYSNEGNLNLLKRQGDVAYLGSFYEGRGIEIIESLALRMPNITFDLYGNDNKYCPSSSNINAHGRVPNSIVMETLSEFKVLLMPYQFNTKTSGGDNTVRWMSPLKLFEYMRSRSVIISSDLPVLKEILNESNSILVSPENIDEWEAAIIKSLSDPIESQRLADNAFRTSVDYSLESRAKNLISLVQ